MSSGTPSNVSRFLIQVGDTCLSTSCSYSSPTEWSDLTENKVVEEYEGEANTTTGIMTGSKIIWSNYDLIGGDSVVMEKSDPVPVKTAFVYDKKSFLSGFATGLCGRGVATE